MATTFSDALASQGLKPFSILVALLGLTVLVFDGLDIQALGLVAPLILEEWGIDRSTFGPAMAAALFGMAFGAFFGGWLGDRFGRKTMLVIAALTFGVATIAAAYTHDVWTMTAVRALGGLGFGAAYPNSMALANDWMPPRWRSYTVATLSLGVPAGTMISATLASMLIAWGGWQGVFMAFGGASIALALILLFALKESPPYWLAKGDKDKAQRVARMVLDEDVELAPEGGPLPVGGSASGERIGVFHPTNKRLNIGLSISFAASTAIAYGLSSWSVEFLTSRGFTLDQALQAPFFIGLFSMIGGFSAGYFARRIGSRPAVTWSAAWTCLLVLVLTAMMELMAPQDSAVLRFLTTLVIGLITGAVSVGVAMLYVMMAHCYPQECRSAGIGFGMLTGRVGGILMAFGGGWLLNLAGDSYIVYFLALFLAAVLMFAVPLIVDRHVEPVGKA